jgi:predicted Fe-Mo cluster-binding NifX family protein
MGEIMKIAFPSQEDKGMDSPVYSHFGSARFFTIVDSDNGKSHTQINLDVDHLHGQCQPVRALGDQPVDAIVVGGIGGGALRKLQQASIQVFRGVEGTVQENLDLFRDGKLPEFAFEQVCKGHGGNGGCAH